MAVDGVRLSWRLVNENWDDNQISTDCSITTLVRAYGVPSIDGQRDSHAPWTCLFVRRIAGDDRYGCRPCCYRERHLEVRL